MHRVASWFGNYVTMERRSLPAQTQFILHTAQWKEMPLGLVHKNKLRVVWIADVKIEAKGVPAEAEADMGKLYDAVDASIDAGVAALRKRIELKAAPSAAALPGGTIETVK